MTCHLFALLKVNTTHIENVWEENSGNSLKWQHFRRDKYLRIDISLSKKCFFSTNFFPYKI